MSICFIAHRGYSGRYLENSEEAFLKAVEHGSGGIETDVRLTKDGVLVVNHNSEVVFEDGTDLLVAEHTYEELTAKPLRNRFTDTKLYLCTFRRYLEICRDGNMVCFIEFKGSFPDEKIVEAFELAREVYDLRMCSLQSGEFDNLTRAHEMFPELMIMFTACDQVEEAREIDLCLEHGFDIDMRLRNADQPMVDKFHAKGLRVALWTANLRKDLDYCLSLNPDYIESDFFKGPEGE